MAAPTVINEAEGLYLNQASTFIGQLSPTVGLSLHYPLNVEALYEFWAEVDWLLYVTDALTDPPPIPTTPEQPYPGSLVMAGGILRWQFVPGDDVVTASGNYVATGFRAVSLSGAAGRFFCNRYNRRIR